VKIAVPTNDGIGISAHFGRCPPIPRFRSPDGQVKLVEARTNAGCHEHGSGPGDGVAEPRSHSGFVEALRDCETVLCSGNRRGRRGSAQGGVEYVWFLSRAAGSAEQIVTAFQSGDLRLASGGMCQLPGH